MQNCNWLSKTPTRRRGDAAKLSDASGLLPPPCGLPADAWLSRVAGAPSFVEVVGIRFGREETRLERVLEEQHLTHACVVGVHS